MSERCGNSCSESPEQQVRALYTELALHPEKDFGWGKGKANARALGYDPAWLKRLPDAVWESAAAVGNPFAIGRIHPGETVVDLGCGAGADVCVAALLVGSGGRVIGVDSTSAMVEKARANAVLAGVHNIEIIEADVADVPCPDACADVVISNGSINLSPQKACVLKEVFRLLKPGGQFYIADMVNEAITPVDAESAVASPSWADCVAGTISSPCFLEKLSEAGFIDTELVGTTGYRTSAETIGALLRGRKPTRE